MWMLVKSSGLKRMRSILYVILAGAMMPGCQRSGRSPAAPAGPQQETATETEVTTKSWPTTPQGFLDYDAMIEPACQEEYQRGLRELFRLAAEGTLFKKDERLDQLIDESPSHECRFAFAIGLRAGLETFQRALVAEYYVEVFFHQQNQLTDKLPALREFFHERFEQAGLDPSKIELEPTLGDADQLLQRTESFLAELKAFAVSSGEPQRFGRFIVTTGGPAALSFTTFDYVYEGDKIKRSADGVPEVASGSYEREVRRLLDTMYALANDYSKKVFGNWGRQVPLLPPDT